VEQSGATFSNIPPNPHSGATGEGFGLGDAVYAVTQALGIPHCGECAKRRERLNSLWQISQSKNPLQSYIMLQSLRKDRP
jgi:hypothetical protein